MFSNWFSGDGLERYRTSPHKQRIDAIASRLLRLKYASEVIRQHLHEWLRFPETAVPWYWAGYTLEGDGGRPLVSFAEHTIRAEQTISTNPVRSNLWTRPTE